MGRQVASVASSPAPTGGWNAHDALSAMPETDAIVLTNWIPDVGNVAVRPGYSSHVTSLPGPAYTLMPWTGATAEKLLAATTTSIYDVTVKGAVGAALTAGKTSGHWQHTMFGAGASNYLVMCNGADGVWTYDGTTFVDRSAAITGVTATNLVNVAAHMSRLWFIERNSLRVWYMPLSAIAGAATSLDLRSLCKRGGYLVAMASWTRDGGNGPDDYAVFITSKGELIVYQGTDPSSTLTSALVGTFKIPEPIGYRCIMKAGGDVAILTSQGVLPLSGVTGLNESGVSSVAMTNKIDRAFNEAFIAAGTFRGWQVFQYPRRGIVIVNVPLSEAIIQEQYVLNVKTGAWARWTGMNAGTWGLIASNLYFADNVGTIWAFDQGAQTDNDLPIIASLQAAYSMFNTPGRKRFGTARALFVGPEEYAPLIVMKLDYDVSPQELQIITEKDGRGARWDITAWDEDYWAPEATPTNYLQSVSGVAFAGSLAFTIAVASALSYHGSVLSYEAGGLL